MRWEPMAAGCNFFAGYPITPATTIFNTMLKLLPPGGRRLSSGAKMRSLPWAIAWEAAMGGAKAMTATSGPGISLYSEQISFCHRQRDSRGYRRYPAAGAFHRIRHPGADGDIQFLQWGSSGGQPVVVLAPVDIQDCYTLTMQAFNLAERFRCPVFIASNKEIGMTGKYRY